MLRHYSPLDRGLISAQQALARLFAGPRAQRTPDSPSGQLQEAVLDDDERRHAAGLMRINHAGEVAAQALYRGQALVARESGLRAHLLHAADEEYAHLKWCEQRLQELDSRPSRLEPLWYAGSFAIGAAAGLAGDRISLGFVAETEAQVVAHLDQHLRQLPAGDARSRAVLKVMKEDELRHGGEAQQRGGRTLPAPVRRLMGATALVMKRLAYRM